MNHPIRLVAASCAGIEPAVQDDEACVPTGDGAIDAILGGGLQRATLHELFAVQDEDTSAVAGFAALLAQRGEMAGKPLLWLGTTKAKPLYAPGLSELGANPARFTLVHVPDVKAMLRAAGDIVTCGAVSALVIEGWEKPAALDLTITRRLALAAARSGVFTLLLRQGPDPPPSAARTRWRIAPAPSIALAGNAPGAPAFDIELFRHRGGVPGFSARLEWNRDTSCFKKRDALPRRAPAAPPVRADQDAHARSLWRAA
jgi:protein ImuA